MAYVYKNNPGRRSGTQYKIASLDGVQDWLDRFIFEAAVRAEEDLIEHRQDGHARIEVEAGDIDRYLILSDEYGQKAAMSIEYGRQPYEVKRDDGSTFEAGGMEGLFILHKALRIPKGKLKGKGGGK